MHQQELATSVFTAPRSRRGRRRLILLGTPALLLLALLATYYYATVSAERDLQKALAETDQSDPGWRIFELEAKRARFPEEQNSAVNIVNAVTLIPPSWPQWDAGTTANNPEEISEFTESLRQPDPPALLDVRQTEALRKELNRAAQALAETYKVADKPHGRLPLTYTKDLRGTPLRDTQNSRRIATLLGYDALLRAQDRDLEGAMKACRCMLHVERAIGDQPDVISMLIRFGIQRAALKRIERCLAQGELAEQTLANLQQLLQEDLAEPMLLNAARGNRALDDGCLAAIQSGEYAPSWRQLQGSGNPGPGGASGLLLDIRFKIVPRSVTADRAALLRFNNQFVELAKLPVEQQTAKLSEINLDIKQLPAVAQALANGSWDKIVFAFHSNQAYLPCGIIMLAAERYRLAHQRWPERMDTLVPKYLPQVYADPFDSQPLRLRPFAGGLVIYSVGHNREDDGGNLHDHPFYPNSDYGYRLWNVAKRRQPPKSSRASDIDTNK